MATIIQLRRDTAANWTANNPILADGEPALEKDTGKEKIGDGVTAWNSLPYKVSEASGGETTVVQNINYSNIIDKTPLIATNAVTPLTIPTYDGSNQPIHPRVLYFENGWNGYKYWMCFTPYPGSNSALENPSVVASNDNETWVVPNGLTNPIFPAPATGYNSDSELVYDEANDLLWLVNRWFDTNSVIQVKSSPDGVNWSSTTDIFTASGNFVSPTIVPDGGVFRMFYVEGDAVKTTTSASINSGWNLTNAITMAVKNKPVSRSFWHISVNKIKDQYHFFICFRVGGAADFELYFGDTSNYSILYVAPNRLLGPGATGNFDALDIYQASGIILPNGNYGLYYTGYGEAIKGIGYTEVPVTYYDNLSQTGNIKSLQRITVADHAALAVKEETKLYIIIG